MTPYTNTLNANLFDFYRFNVLLGIKRKKLKQVLGGIDYFRCLEYPLVFNNLKLSYGHILLDIGSGNSIFPLFVASKGVQVLATDIDNCVVKLKEDAAKLRIFNFNAGVMDVRSLLTDNQFDRVTAVSTLEHIPSDGDTKAIKEMSRVLKPSGYIVITVPYGSYEEERQKDVNYFQRVYNYKSLYKRLILPSKLKVEKLEYFGEKINFLKYYQSSDIFRLLSPIFSKLYLSISENNMSFPNKDLFMRTGGCCLTLKKL